MFLAILGAIVSITAGVVKGVSEVQSSKHQMNAVRQQAHLQVNERARVAKKLLSEQKSSFLKSGVFFEGTPETIFDETYNVAQSDMSAMNNDALNQQKQLMRQGRTAFFGNVLDGVKNAVTGYAMGGLLSSLGSAGSIGGVAGGTSKLSGGFGISNADILGKGMSTIA